VSEKKKLSGKYPLSKPPEPSVEPANPPWVPEKWDVNLPSELGFITDFVFATRGFEAPTKFAVWGSLFAISAIIKRHAWLDWYPTALYPNLYLIFVAPPRINAKSTSVKFGLSVVDRVPEVLGPTTQMGIKKKINVVRSKITPEAIYDVLKPFKEGDIDHGSNAAFVISELTTLLNKQKYNVTLIDTLTKFYDCDDKDSEQTRGGGKTELRNIYVSLFGATTPMSFEKSLPEEAFGGGFMSRTIVVTERKPTRYYPEPFKPDGAPDRDELAERLGWIARNAQGTYILSKEAKKVYYKWYKEFKDELAASGDYEALEKSRMDTNLLKVALLVRASRYEEGRVISNEDFLYALKIMENVYEDDNGIMDNVGTTQMYQFEQQVVKLLKDRKKMIRKELLQTLGRSMSMDLVDKVLASLAQKDHIEVYTCRKSEKLLQDNPTQNKLETYEWKGGS
jgi:hypothetical protein